jgi:hypothetical protein
MTFTDQPSPVDAVPAAAPRGRKPRVRRRRTRPRSKTIARKKLTRVVLAVGAAMFPPVEDVERPRTRRDCQSGGCNEQRPCPWVSCKHHLYLDVNPETGSIKFNRPELEPWDMVESCALDIAERGGLTLDEVGDAMNVTRERVRQIEVRGLIRLKMASPTPEDLGKYPTPDITRDELAAITQADATPVPVDGDEQRAPRRGRQPNTERDAAIVERLRGGEAPEALAVELDLTVTRVNEIGRAGGIRRTPGRPRSVEVLDDEAGQA